jgi:hypothetical protein
LLRGGPALRYFLDTEYNGWRGALLSLALVPEDGGEEFYATVDWSGSIEPWVGQHVIPYLDMVPEGLISPRLSLEDAAAELSAWLVREHQAQGARNGSMDFEIVADWPEDISQFCSLLIVGPGLTVDVPPMTFRLLQLPGFSPAANSRVPHNALHDARALRDHVLEVE